MKAKIKVTGEIVDGNAIVSFQGDDFYLDELEFLDNDPDYWTRLKHQYAGMAMQGFISNGQAIPVNNGESIQERMSIMAISVATTLVEKLKGESPTTSYLSGENAQTVYRAKYDESII